jgi:SNF2 family DNA or RNA helicase
VLDLTMDGDDDEEENDEVVVRETRSGRRSSSSSFAGSKAQKKEKRQKKKDKGKGKQKVRAVREEDEDSDDEIVIVEKGEENVGWWWNDKSELERRKDAFLYVSPAASPPTKLTTTFHSRHHSSTFLPLFPTTSSNYITKLLNKPSSSSPGPVHPYRLLPQPLAIAGGKSNIMKSYQLQGLSFLAYMAENGMSCILADEMGLGKTLQTLSLIAYLSEAQGKKGSHLLICPLSVLGAWMVRLFCPPSLSVGQTTDTCWNTVRDRSLASRIRTFPFFFLAPFFLHLHIFLSFHHITFRPLLIDCILPSSLQTSIRFHGPAAERSRLKSEFPLTKPNLVVTTYEAYVAEERWFKSMRWGLCVLDEGCVVDSSFSSFLCFSLRS